MDTEEQEHIASVIKAMKEKGVLDHTIVHGVFVGPARSGKNSLMERLLGQMPSRVSPSTGVAESTIQVKVIQKATTIAANVEGCLWSRMDYDDEAIRLMLINSDHHKSLEISMVQMEQPSTDLPEDYDDKDSLNTSNQAESDDEWFDASSTLPQELPSVPPPNRSPPPQVLQVCPRLPGSYVPPIEIVKLALRNKGKKGLEILQQHFQKTWSLYLTNTGGQMEFQEVLPLLVSGPSLFFFTFRLDRDLNERYDIEYEHPDGAKAKPYTSTLTTMEGLLQTLATIAAMGTFVYQGLQKRKLPLRPKVFLVGTHRDKLDSKTANERIASIDQELQKAIQATSHYENLVEFATDTQLIFAVDNFSESDSDFKDIRSAVERVIIRDEFQMTSPAHWLIFSLALRKLESEVVSYDQCLEIARQCGLADNEFDQALKFIHSKMGLIRYFPYEDVKNLVVINPQFLFDKVTELIIDTFTFEKTGKHQTDEFRHKGIFSLSRFESIRLREKSNNLITPFKFAKLLERLRIAAPFHLKGEKKYFLPCVLAHSAKEGAIRKMLTSTSVPRLMITFECGFCPKGLAGALIKYLIADEAQSCYTWKLCHKKIFRNQVSFKVGPHETMTLKIFSTHLEIILIPNRTFPFVRGDKVPLDKVCCEICRVLEDGIRKVTADINYVDAQHSLTFSCECKNCKGSYPGKLEIVDNAPYCISCVKDEDEGDGRQLTFLLTEKHKLWWTKNNSESTVQSAPSDVCAATSVRTTELSEDHHSVLFKQLTNHSSKWRDIGLHLGFKSAELDVIQAKPLLLDSAPNSWLSKLLAEWLQWAPGDSRGSTSSATLEGIKNALREAGLGAKADDLRISKNY